MSGRSTWCGRESRKWFPLYRSFRPPLREAPRSRAEGRRGGRRYLPTEVVGAVGNDHPGGGETGDQPTSRDRRARDVLLQDKRALGLVGAAVLPVDPWMRQPASAAGNGGVHASTREGARDSRRVRSRKGKGGGG